MAKWPTTLNDLPNSFEGWERAFESKHDDGPHAAGYAGQVRRDGQSIIYRQHNTDVVTYNADGTIRLNTSGWRTVSTKARINALLPSPWAVGSVRLTRRLAEQHGLPDFWARAPRAQVNQWFLHYRGQPVKPFEDGVQFDPVKDAPGRQAT